MNWTDTSPLRIAEQRERAASGILERTSPRTDLLITVAALALSAALTVLSILALVRLV